MSVKPTVMPISPNDARSAIRVQKQLESDILRLREDIKRRSCNIPAARQAIALKERQMAQIQAFLRQHHVDLEQFDRRAAERHRQALRRQDAMFETRRREATPGKHSVIAKRARLDKNIEIIKAPSLPAPVKLPAPSPAQKRAARQDSSVASKRRSPTDTSMFFEAEAKDTLALISEAGRIDGRQLLRASGSRPSWNLRPSDAELRLLQQMLERIYQTRATEKDSINAYKHLDLVYRTAKVPEAAKLPGPNTARAMDLNTPPVNPAEAARRRQVEEMEAHRARQELARKERELQQKAEEMRRGAQARREEMERMRAKREEEKEIARKQAAETQKRLANEAARRKAEMQEKKDLRAKQAHEKMLAEQNAKRAAEAKAKEEARIAQERAEQAARQKAVREQQMAQKAKEMKAQEMMLKEKHNTERKYREAKTQINEMEKMLQQITNEMQAAKVAHPEVMDDLRDHRMRITEELVNMKRAAAPLEAEIRRVENKMSRDFKADNTAGLRAWHRDVLSSGHGRRQLSSSQRKMIRDTCASLPADQKERVKNLVARWEQGSDVDLGSEIQSIVAAHTANTAQALGHAAAIQGTPRHIKHGMSSVAQNNYQRLRQIQGSEDEIKDSVRKAEEAATAQGETLSGLFPKLRSSVTRTVGH